MNLRVENDFRCTPERLFQCLEELELQKQWMTGLLDKRQTSAGPVGVGTTFEMDIQEGRRTSTYQCVLTHYDPPRSYGLTVAGGCMGPKMKMHGLYELEPRGETTHLVHSCTSEGTPAFVRFLAPLLRFFARLQLRGFFKKLRALVESR